MPDEIVTYADGASSEAARINGIVNRLATKIQNRRPDIRKHTDYVTGVRGRLKFSSDEFKRYMSDRFSDFCDNWCLPVAQAPVERIAFKGFVPYDDVKLDSHFARCWERNDADRGLQEAALMMTTTGRAFILLTQRPDGKARISFEHPDSAAMLYDALTGEPSAGLIVRQDDENEYGTLFLPDMVFDVRRVRPDPMTDDRIPPDVLGWEFIPETGRVNPYGEIPMRELRNQMLLDNNPVSDIAQVESMQDTVNIIWAYLLNALDYASMPARVIMGGDPMTEPVFDDKTGMKIGERPVELDQQVLDRITQLTGDNVSIGEWTSSNLNAFIPVIEKAVEHIAAETRTPGHYLLTKAEVPATGYEVAEAGLVSKTKERISFLKAPIRDICRMAMLTEDDRSSADIIAESRVVFATPQYRSEALMADAMLKYQQMGYPLQWIAEQMGQSQEDIDRIMRMKRDEESDPDMQEIARSLRGAGDDDIDDDDGRNAQIGVGGGDGGGVGPQSMEEGQRE